MVSLPGSRRGSGTGQPPHTRGQSTAAPLDSPSTPTASTPTSSETTFARNLSSLLGLTVRLTLIGAVEITHEGSIFAVDTRTGFVALECAPTMSTASTSTSTFAPGAGKGQTGGGGEKADYRLIRLSQIKSVTPLIEVPVKTVVQPKAISTQAIERIEAEAVRAEEAKLARLGPSGTSAYGQEVFDAFAKTCVSVSLCRVEGEIDALDRMPTRWQHTTIIVLDDCQVAPPYQIATGPNGPKLDRVKKVLDGERERIRREKPELA